MKVRCPEYAYDFLFIYSYLGSFLADLRWGFSADESLIIAAVAAAAPLSAGTVMEQAMGRCTNTPF